ncbi:MAG: LTA synthase family protein [Clostridia bacterium]|nr:LTA synthase family protein [Clostridia bacterium]
MKRFMLFKRRSDTAASMIPEILFTLFFFGSIMVKCFYLQYATKINMRPFTSSVNNFMLLSSIGILLGMIAVVIILFGKRRSLVLLILDIGLSVLLLADTLYYRYYYSALTIPVLYQLGLVGSVKGSILSLFKPRDLVYLIDLPILIAGFIFLVKKGLSHIVFVKRAIIGAAILVLGVICFQISYYKQDTNTIHFDKNYAIKVLGIMYYHYYDAKNFVMDSFKSKSLTADEKSSIESFYKEKTKTSENFKGIAKGKNLIIIQVEALQQFIINSKVNGKEVTPNLNKLMKESVYFDNFYNQVLGGNTSDAEFLTNTSLYPIKSGAVYFRYPTNEYHTLPKELKKQGYNSYAFHAYTPGFWNRNTMYRSIGFDKYINFNDYTIDEYVGWGGFALSDSSFYRQSLAKIDKSKPFYGFFITLSSHHPYTYFETKGDFDPGEYKGTLLGRYLKAAHYADSALGQFIESLKKEGLYDKSLILVYGDHTAVPKDESQDVAKLLGIENNAFEQERLQRVPLFVMAPGLEKGKVLSTAAGQIDIMPTVANLMGFEAPFALGKDLFNTSTSYAVIKQGSFTTDNYIYISNVNQAFDLKSKQPVGQEVFKKDQERIQKEIDISNMIIEKNAFKKIKGE